MVCLAILSGAIIAIAVGCSDDSNPPATRTNNDTGACRMTAGGIEICDGVDNDCDGEVDEDYEVGESCSVEGRVDPGKRSNVLELRGDLGLVELTLKRIQTHED